jgi:hypothetical protein
MLSEAEYLKFGNYRSSANKTYHLQGGEFLIPPRCVRAIWRRTQNILQTPRLSREWDGLTDKYPIIKNMLGVLQLDIVRKNQTWRTSLWPAQ